jgi:hypothetical protein
MHSAPRLFGQEFPVVNLGAAGASSRASSLADAFPDYHAQDRTAVVAPDWEAGFVQNAAAVTALTALFYDAQRSSGRLFYTYPSHYLLLSRDDRGICTSGAAKPASLAAAGRPWGNLDVWPETQWSEGPGDTISLLRAIFALHAHRVFWPEDHAVTLVGARLPHYVRLILASRLKAVYFYNTAAPSLEISLSAGARELLAATPRVFSPQFLAPERGRYRVVDSETFLRPFESCFEAAPPHPAAED